MPDRDLPDDLALPEAEPLRKARDVHHDLSGAIAPDPATSTGLDTGRVGPVKETREFRPLVGHEQPFDVFFVFERVHRRNRELHNPSAKHMLLVRHNLPAAALPRKPWPD